MLLDETTVRPYARGCAVLGGGGGGDPGIALEAALHEIGLHGPVAVLDVDEVPDDGIIMPCALVGAPTVVAEKLWNGDEALWLRDQLEEVTGKRVRALMVAEIGGVNGVMPVACAARLGLPLVDADGMGRAYPHVNQMALHLRGVSGTPCVVVDVHGNVVVLLTTDNQWLDTVIRSVVAACGGLCVAALYPMGVAEMRDAALRGSVSRALRIGAAADGALDDPIVAVCDEAGATELIRGRIVDVERRTSGGAVHGSFVTVDVDDPAGRMVRVEFQHENLVALSEGAVLVTAPDVITVLDAHTGAAISNERLRYGQRVAVIAFPCDEVWRTGAGLRLGGPAAFGLDVPYVPVEEGVRAAS